MPKALSHVALLVHDFDIILPFYTETLGLRQAFRIDEADGSPKLIYLAIAPMHFLELLPSDKVASTLPVEHGYAHICLEVEDIQAYRDRLISLGIAVTEVVTGFTRCKLCWINDPEGNLIELMEFPPDCMQRQASQALFAEDRI